MGNHASGRRRATKRPTFEDLERRDARDFGTRVEAMPDGGAREIGLCPACHQGAREVFKRPGASGTGQECFACRRCLRAEGVRHKSENASGTIAARLRQAPQLLGEAIEAATIYAHDLESGTPPDEKRFLFAMGIFNAAADQAPDEPTPLAKAQAQIIADDLARTSKLVDHLETLIFSGEENHVNRKGEASVTPMRPDSLAKLGNLYLSALNVRANRAGIATTISERQEVEGKRSVGDMFREALATTGHVTMQGHSYADVLDNKPLPALVEDQPDEAPIIYKGGPRPTDESEVIEGEVFDPAQN